MSDTLYLVLDMINDLVHPQGPNGNSPYGVQCRERQIVQKTAVAVLKARAAGVPLGFVRIGFSPDYRECPRQSPIFGGARKAGLFKLGTWGCEVHPDIAPAPNDFDIVKHRVSPFYSTSLEAVLRAQGTRRVVCSGISTNAVVQATVREGHDRDYEMVVLEDACCAMSAEEHESAVKTMGRFARFVKVDEFDFAA
ncbi:MAG: isochorismatase family cysteine hydrolase [Betaproteobacteria bacterium]|jgi:nicotinamidase-related amidase